MAKQRTLLQKNISNFRRIVRQHEEKIARSHRGCATARGCGCVLDRALALMDTLEHELFVLELESYASHGLKDGGGYEHYKNAEAEANKVTSVRA